MSAADATLVIGPGWVGDGVMAHCLVRTLKEQTPDTPIDVLVPAHVASVMQRMAEVRRVIASPIRHGELALGRRHAQGRELRGHYAAAYVLPGSWKSAVVPWVARIPRRIGFLGEWRRGLINVVRPNPGVAKRMTAATYQALADPAVLSDRTRLKPPCLRVDQANRDRLLSELGLAGRAFAALVPGAEFGPAKRWPVRHWTALAEQLKAQGLAPVLLGGPGDREVTGAIAAGISPALDLAGKTRLEDAIDLLAAARVAITNDSGLMHVAAAVGTPVVAVYGSTSPADTPPLSARAAVVTLGLACSPCRRRTCPLGHLDCLERLEPARVATAIAGVLGA